MARITFGAFVVAACVLTSLGGARAGTIDFGVGEDSVRGSVGFPLPAPNLELDVGWLHNDDDRDVASVGVHLTETLGTLGVEAAVGARGYYVDVDDSDGGALALGGRVAVPIPLVPRLWIGGNGYFAPDASAFGDLEGFYEIGASVEYRLAGRAGLYVGARRLRGNLEGGSVTIDDDVHFGIRLTF